MLSSRLLSQRSAACWAAPYPLLAGAARTRQQLWKVPRASCPTVRRAASSALNSSSVEAGENKSGHIHTDPNEGIFFLDNIFPLKLQWMLQLPFVNADRSIAGYLDRMKDTHLSQFDPMNVVKRASPDSLSIQINEIIPRVKEGGAYVKFVRGEQAALSEIERTWKTHLKENPIRPVFNPWRRVRGNLVKGRPWVEDLARFPSPRVKIEFLPTAPGNEAAELNEEQLFSLLRKYGKIADISPQPSDSKVLPRYATVTFKLSRHAVMAKNCMHGFTLPESHGGGKTGTLLKIGYERIIKAHWIRDWITSHPRVVIPLLAALLAGIAVAVFDPIRTFFVKAHISQSFHISDYKIYRWIASQLSRANNLWLFRRRSDDSALIPIWDDRKGDIEQIRTWLMETADTFIVIQGPRGSGKKELVVDQALAGRPHTLVLDCKPIQEARGDSATINAAAKQVGYRPVFSWMNSISSMIDIAAQGTIGTKTGFSETLDAQLVKIFGNTSNALRAIALEARKKEDKDADIGDDEWLEAHPERRPAVVIDNFLHKSNESSLVYDKISEWAATITTANVAHVIFLTHDVSFSKSLSKSLPDRVFRQLSLGDLSAEVAKKYVIRHIDADTPADGKANGEVVLSPSQKRKDLQELDSCIEVIGGRLTDLEFLGRRIKSGESPKKAVQEIIEQSASEILKMYILDTDRASRTWSPIEAWYLIRALATSDTIRYNEVLLSDIFKSGGDGTLQALEQAELISIVSENGRPYCVKPGKPVYSAAFRYLLNDRVLQARLDLATFTELTKVESQSIDKYEAELNLLGHLPRHPPQLADRIQWLLGKLQGAQTRVQAYEAESGKLKKILQSEY